MEPSVSLKLTRPVKKSPYQTKSIRYISKQKHMLLSWIMCANVF